MSQSIEKSSQYLAANIRQLREIRGLSQEQLAKISGIPRPTWANLESGGSNPTLAVLLGVSSALQVSLEELLSSPKGDGKLYSLNELPSRKRGEAMIRGLVPDPISGVEVDRMQIPPGSRLVGVPHRSGTQEYFCSERGEFQVTISGNTWTVQEGEVLSFRGDQKHSYQNTSTKTAIGFSVVLLAP